jgi:hypothetical protein
MSTSCTHFISTTREARLVNVKIVDKYLKISHRMRNRRLHHGHFEELYIRWCGSGTLEDKYSKYERFYVRFEVLHLSCESL